MLPPSSRNSGAATKSLASPTPTTVCAETPTLGFGNDLLRVSSNGSLVTASSPAALSQEQEDLFLRISFELGINPTPRFGIDRNMAATAVVKWINTNLRAPQIARLAATLPVRRGDYFSDTASAMERLALTDAYLDWLYEFGARRRDP